MKKRTSVKTPPPQKQAHQPGVESKMRPRPEASSSKYKGSEKLTGKIALITGGDSGIGKAVAILFAKEKADIAISYLEEHEDADKTKREVENENSRCELISGDISDEKFCLELVKKVVKKFGRIDILVNNAGEQHTQNKFEDITSEQLIQTFSTNVFSFFYLTKAVIPYMPKGGVIINTTLVTAYKGSPNKIDYSSTKGAIVSFTRSLALSLVEKEIRVNAVAPGPIWTPLIPSTMTKKEISEFGQNVPMKRMGQPDEVAPCYVFLASADSSYMTGQVLHPNGGTIVNG